LHHEDAHRIRRWLTTRYNQVSGNFHENVFFISLGVGTWLRHTAGDVSQKCSETNRKMQKYLRHNASQGRCWLVRAVKTAKEHSQKQSTKNIYYIDHTKALRSWRKIEIFINIRQIKWADKSWMKMHIVEQRYTSCFSSNHQMSWRNGHLALANNSFLRM